VAEMGGVVRRDAAHVMPSMSPMRAPMAVPKTMKYSDVDSTGEAMLCIRVRPVRAISKR
jgi:hypothetical protein